MKKSVVLFAVSFLFLISDSLLAQALPVVGKWKTVDDKDGSEKSVVEIYEQDGKIFGKIISLRDPLNKQGLPHTCKRCTGDDKDKPVVGLVFLKDLSLDGDEYTGGTITDPESGKIYKCKIQAVESGQKLKVRGFIGISLIGRTQIWLKK